MAIISSISPFRIIKRELTVTALAGNSAGFTVPFMNKAIIKTVRIEAFFTDVQGNLAPASDSSFDITLFDAPTNGVKIYESVNNTYLDYDMVEIPYIDSSHGQGLYGSIVNKDTLLNITYKLTIMAFRAN